MCSMRLSEGGIAATTQGILDARMVNKEIQQMPSNCGRKCSESLILGAFSLY